MAKPKGIGEKIVKLRSEGKSYNEIKNVLGCSKSAVCYHCGHNQKKQYERRSQKQHPYIKKISRFKHKNSKSTNRTAKFDRLSLLSVKIYNFKLKGNNMSEDFTLEDVINKFGENPVCYLTGEQINIRRPSTYQFDHIIPASRGGKNTLSNLQICTKKANAMKSNMTPDELLNMCRIMLEYRGFTVSKSL